MRRTKWNVEYERVQPVMWDLTNIPAFGCTDPECNRITYSRCYNQNCFKGGVFAQLCGWVGMYDSWTGAVSDTDYNKWAGYLKIQKQYAKNDMVDSKLLPFTNIYNKGYRARCIAWKEGQQLVLQPEWAESDKQFNRQQTFLTASVATNRGGMKEPSMCAKEQDSWEQASSQIRLPKSWTMLGLGGASRQILCSTPSRKYNKIHGSHVRLALNLSCNCALFYGSWSAVWLWKWCVVVEADVWVLTSWRSY